MEALEDLAKQRPGDNYKKKKPAAVAAGTCLSMVCML